MRSALRTAFGGLLGLILGLLVSYVAGESPVHVVKILFNSAFGSAYSFGMTLFYTLPLVLTGIAVAIPYRAGLFNIGGEGQLIVGALKVASVFYFFPHLPRIPGLILCVIAALGGGGFIGGAIGWLKAKRGSHEVITSIMFNFICAAYASYWVMYRIKDLDSQNVESVSAPAQFQLASWDFLQGAPVGWISILIIILALLLDRLLEKSTFGYALKAVGLNEKAAELAGIRKESVWIQSMALGGAIAGLVGIVEVLGNSHRYILGFSADYGYMGIAVALVAQGKIRHILWSAFLFGALQKGAGDLDLETKSLNRDLVYWIQALVILGVSVNVIWENYLPKFKKRTVNT